MDSSVYQFLADSEVTLYSDIATFMQQRATTVANSSQGLEKVGLELSNLKDLLAVIISADYTPFTPN